MGIPTRVQFARNVLVNWIAMFASMLVPFFLSPFTVHRLGNVVYGLWVLVVSSVSYFYLLDLGLRNAITAYVSKYETVGDREGTRRVISAAIWMRVAILMLIVLLSALVAGVFPKIFSVATELRNPVRESIAVSGIAVALTLAAGVPSAILAAQHRYDLLGYISILRSLLRATGFFILLDRGFGIVALSAWELCASAMVFVVTAASSRPSFSGAQNLLSRPQLAMFRRLWSYSAYAFLITMAGAVVSYTDNAVVGALLSPAAVTFYAIAGNLVLASREMIAAMSNTFVPIASGLDADGDKAKLRRLLLRGTQASLLLSFPTVLLLFFRGNTFLNLWMGREYALQSSTILRILLVNQLLTSANLTSCGIVYGLGKHKPLAAWAVVEGVVNLGLSILLAQRIGILGVAWGTAIAGVICNLMFWPRYIARLVEIPLSSYLVNAWGTVALIATPFAIACWYADRNWRPASLAGFLLQSLALLLTLAVPAVLAFRKQIIPLVPARVQAAFGMSLS